RLDGLDAHPPSKHRPGAARLALARGLLGGGVDYLVAEPLPDDLPDDAPRQLRSRTELVRHLVVRQVASTVTPQFDGREGVRGVFNCVWNHALPAPGGRQADEGAVVVRVMAALHLLYLGLGDGASCFFADVPEAL